MSYYMLLAGCGEGDVLPVTEVSVLKLKLTTQNSSGSLAVLTSRASSYLEKIPSALNVITYSVQTWISVMGYPVPTRSRLVLLVLAAKDQFMKWANIPQSPQTQSDSFQNMSRSLQISHSLHKRNQTPS